MSRVIIIGRGNKRRIRQIRWKPVEIITAILFLLGALTLCLLLGLWMASHPVDD
jgi:hypothetical protein